MTGEDHRRQFVVMNKTRQRAPIRFIFIQPWITSSPSSSLQQVVVMFFFYPSIVLRDSEKKKKKELLSRRYVEFHFARQRDHDDRIKRESGGKVQVRDSASTSHAISY